MKNILLACIMIAFSVIYANAGKNVDEIVCDMLEDGNTPSSIVSTFTTIVNIDPQHVVKALYCCGAEGDDVNDACEEYGIPEIIIIAGFEQAVAECSDVFADSQAYVPVGFFGSPSPSNSRTIASPSTF